MTMTMIQNRTPIIPCWEPGRVLLVGGYRLLLKSLKRGLEEDGYQADIVSADLASQNTTVPAGYDLIVLDLFRPDGPDLAPVRCWRGAGLTTNILVLTGTTKTEFAARGLQTGVDDVLTKPFCLDEFLARVRELVCSR